jgi:hypothetical protein
MTNENKILAQKTITYAIGIGAGYFLVLKPLLVKFGILKSADELAQEQKQGSTLQLFLDYNPAKLTKTIGEWQLIANTIYADLKDLAILDNVNDALYQLTRVKNDDDVKALISTFGKRSVTAFGQSYGTAYELPAFLKNSNLSNGEIESINSNYNRKNIKFRF